MSYVDDDILNGPFDTSYYLDFGEWWVLEMKASDGARKFGERVIYLNDVLSAQERLKIFVSV